MRPATEASHDPLIDEGFVGVILARDAVDVSSPVAGRVHQIFVNLGDRVADRARLVRMDSETLRHDLAEAKAAASMAAAEKKKAELELEVVRDRLARRRTLEDLITKEEWAELQNRERLAGAEVEAASASFEEQQARANKLVVALERTELKAPFEGTITGRFVSSGAWVPAGAPIVRLIRSDDLSLRFAVPASQGTRLSLGAPIVATAATLSITGHIDAIAPEIEPASQTIICEARIDAEQRKQNALQSGLVVRVMLKQVATAFER